MGRSVRRGLWALYALPVIMVLAIVGILVYNRVTHQPPPVRKISGVPFKTIGIDGLKANFFAQGDVLRAAGDDLFIEFRDAKGSLADVGAVTLLFALKMQNSVLHSIPTVNRTATPGQYRSAIQPGVAGEWTATIGFSGSSYGKLETNFVVKIL